MTRQNRMSNFSFVFLALIIMACASWLWQAETRSPQLDYSQVRQLFIQEKVESFKIDSGYNLTLNLRGGTSVGISISAVPVVSVGASDVDEDGIGAVVRAVAAALTRALR